MKRKEIFLLHLYDFLKSDGFELKRNRFVKKNDEDTFVIEYTALGSISQIEPNYIILINEVEQIKKKALGKNYSKYFTLGNAHYIINNMEGYCTLDLNNDMLALDAAELEIIFYKNVLRKYFEEYSNVEYLDKLLNSYPAQKLNTAFNTVDTSFLAIIVAYLVKRANLNELIEIYRNIVGKGHPNRLIDYDLISGYLLAQ
jgi:hypothetical protein